METPLLQSESTKELYAAVIAAQAEFTAVPKNKTARVKSKKTGAEYEYKYADLADVMSMALPVLSKHGVGVMQPHVRIHGPDGMEVRVCTRLVHKSGEWLQSDGLVIDEKAEPQDVGSESSYFRRYDFCSTLAIVADEDVDGERGSPRAEKKTRPQDVTPPPPLKKGPSEVRDREVDQEREKVVAKLKSMLPAKELGERLKKMFPNHDPKVAWALEELKQMAGYLEKEAAEKAARPVGIPPHVPPDVAAMFGEGSLTTGSRIKGPTIGLGKAKRLLQLLSVHKVHTRAELDGYLKEIGVREPADIPQDIYDDICSWAEGSREDDSNGAEPADPGSDPGPGGSGSDDDALII